MEIKCFVLEKTDQKKASADGVIISPLYRRVDTGELMTLNEAPPGALWRCTWYENIPELTGIDGQSWCCKTPGGHWCIDSVASNCGNKGDLKHKCWCRHGVAPNFTVDKNGHTCTAGGGSIQCGTYHGFLRNGSLVD